MNRSEVLRDLYEALDLLDAVQTGAARPTSAVVPVAGSVAPAPAYTPSVDLSGAGAVIDLREQPSVQGTVLPGASSLGHTGGLRHQVRLRLGSDWDSTGRR